MLAYCFRLNDKKKNIMPQNCINYSNTFCYVRGSFTTKAQRHIGCPLEDQDKDWAPHVICTSCSNGLSDWMNKTNAALSFTIPMIWQEPKNHVGDCYFYCVIINGFSAKNKHKILYSNLNSAMRPITHDDNLTGPEPPENGLAFLEQMECEDGSSLEAIHHSSDDQYVP
jgi:hypothetical protein